MEAYTIYKQGEMGFEYDRSYAKNYSRAIQEFNNLIRKSMKEVHDTIEKDDFSEEVASFKEWDMSKRFDGSESGIELICRKCPIIVYKKNDKLIARVYSWEKPSYEYGEQDITSEEVILKKIELLE